MPSRSKNQVRPRCSSTPYELSWLILLCNRTVYVVFMHAFESCTSLFLFTSILEQIVEKFESAVNQLSNLTAHVASAPIAACTEALADLKRKLGHRAELEV